MKTITTNNRTLLFVEVPTTAHHFSIDQGYLTWLNVSDNEDVLAQLPEGNYRFIATTDTITEEQAAMFVETLPDMMSAWYVNYTNESGFFSSSIDSFATLIQHHSITGRHAIIEVL